MTTDRGGGLNAGAGGLGEGATSVGGIRVGGPEGTIGG